MCTRALLPLLALGLGLGVLAATAAPPLEKPDKPDADKIAKLIAQLGSDSFDDREQASADLEALGDPAYGALREALKSTDEEVRKRAELLVGKIEKRRESADALKPKHVHLVYKDTPLTEAVEDFKKQTGYNISLNDPENKLKDRKVTLDTGDVTFWQALDQFCEKAALQETESASNGLAPPWAVPAPPPILRPRRVPIQPAPGGAAPLAAPPAQQPPAPVAPPPPPPPPPPPVGIVVGAPAFPPGVPMTGVPDGITLTDGKADALPTDASSAVRVQALKPDPSTPAPDGEIVLGLRLSIEPRMLFQSVEKVTIRKAVDDQKQDLAQTTTDAAPAVAAPPGGGALLPGAVVGRPVIMPFPGPGMGVGAGDVQQDAVVHLKKGDKASKSLSELSGTISAHILAEATPVITADDIMKVKAGAVFKGGENGQLTIADVAKTPAGQVVIRLELQPPTDSVPIGGANPNPFGRPIRIRPVPLPAPPGGAVAPPAVAGGVAAAIVIGPGGWNAQGAAGLNLLDDKGNVVKQVGSQIQNQVTVVNGVAMVTQMYTLTFQPEKDQEPSKLVYMGRKVLSVDVPFTLKDLPLP